MSFNHDPHSSNSVPVLLRRTALETAEAFAEEHSDPNKARQVYLNTLAIWAVRDYLSFLGIDTDLTQGDSWQKALRLVDNPADLHVVERGVLECLPISSPASAVSVPLELQIRRLAYIVVELEAPFAEAKLMGFATANDIAQDMLLVEQLRPLRELSQYLSQFHYSPLREWFQGHSSEIWQPPDEVLAMRYPAFRFRGQGGTVIKKARIIDLKGEVGSTLKLGLLVAAKPSEKGIYISAQLHSGKADASLAEIENTLPPGLSLELLSDEGDLLESVSARSSPLDNFIQLPPFEGLPNEQYQLRVSLNGLQAIEILAF